MHSFIELKAFNHLCHYLWFSLVLSSLLLLMMMMFGTLWALILEAEDLTHLQFSDVSCERLNRWAEVY